MAALYQSRLAGADTSQSVHMQIIRQARHYPYMLESYHYMKPQIVAAIRDNKSSVFLDSGAFSMFTQGVEVNLESYARFIENHQDIIHVASNLDAIGRGYEQLSYDRQKQLERMGAKIKPVHHVRDADEWLQRYLDEGYDYIFLGGMVPETTPVLMHWLDHVWHHYLTNADGTPKVKVHGFGLTTLTLMFRYPWYSVDSTSWVMTAQFGSIYLDLPQPDGTVKDYKVDFSTQSNKRYDINSWHFNSLTGAERRAVLNRLEELEAARPKDAEEDARLKELTGYTHGFNPTALAESYAWRDYANIEYFRRAMNRKVDRFTRQQETLF
jgi:hypothetical protein